MKKFLLTILKFTGFALFGYFLLIFVWGSFTPLYLRKNLNYRLGAYGHIHSRMKDVKKIEHVDVLILGSSHAYRGFDTRIFAKNGYSAFNLGSSSQTPIQTLMLLEKYLDKLHPKLVILEVYPEIFGLDGVESSLEFVANEKIDWPMLKMVIKVNHIKTYNSFIYSFYRQITGLDRNYKQPDKDGDDLYISGSGFVSREITYFHHMNHDRSSWQFNYGQLKAFDKIVEKLKERKIEFVLVQAPLTAALYNSKTNNVEADSLFNAKGQYINFNPISHFDDLLHFYDPDHLNQNGVELFNDSLILWLKNEKLLDLP